MTEPLTKRAKAICLGCRTLLREGRRCERDKDHRVVSLGDESGKEQLLGRVWGPPSARERAKQLVKVGGSGAGFGLLVHGCGSCGEIASLETLGALVVLAAVLVAGGYWFVTFVWRNVQAYKDRLAPRGATTSCRLGAATGLRGTVRAQPSLTSAACGSACVGYAIELHARRHIASPVMLRHARTAPMVIELEYGSRIDVPAGRVKLVGSPHEVSAAAAQLTRRLALPPRNADDLDPFPGDMVREVRLDDGDVVEVFGTLDREPMAEGGSAYREIRWIYRPSGTLGLRIAARD